MKTFVRILLLYILAISVIAADQHPQNSTLRKEGNSSKPISHNHMMESSIHWEPIKAPFTIATWLLIASVAKIVFAQADTLTKYFPESALLIFIGIILGLVLRGLGLNTSLFTLDSHAFFVYLLPPIIFDAGYFMPNRALFENFDSVLLFSVVGTIWNTLSIGFALYGLSLYNLFAVKFTITQVLVFAALISAVDPVAVIAVFEEIHVNEFLFINVFGEALFNDGVTVVLYKMFAKFAEAGHGAITFVDYAYGILSFFGIALGGIAIGIVFAFIASFATKFTHKVKTIAPVFIFVVPYMAYLISEMTSISSIMAISFCGMVMKTYVKGNIQHSTVVSVKYFTKMLAQSSETVIFMFLGLSAVGSMSHYDPSFIVATLVLCLLIRTIGVVLQCSFLNCFRQKKFSKVDQFILSYGGLRGAIAFGLAVSMSKDIQAQPMFVSTTIMVIFFTVFLQGSTIRPLVNFLNVEKKDSRPPTMAEIVYNKYLDFMMSGIEDIAGQQGTYSYIENFERFNSKILRPLLMKNRKTCSFDATTIVRAYTKITLEEAMDLSMGQQINDSKVQEIEVPKVQFGANLQQQLNAKKIEKFLSSTQNVDSLYTLFSELLDRKLVELEADGAQSSDNEIEDDYIKELRSNPNSHANLQALDEPFSMSGRALARKASRGTIHAIHRKKSSSAMSRYKV